MERQQIKDRTWSVIGTGPFSQTKAMEIARSNPDAAIFTSGPHHNPNTTETLDSLDRVELAMALEDEFGVEIEEDSMNLTSMTEIFDLIERLVAK